MSEPEPAPGPHSWGPEANDQDLFDRLNRERFDAARSDPNGCERCRKRPPTDILRYTAYCAVCRECRDFLLDSIERTIRELDPNRSED